MTGVFLAAPYAPPMPELSIEVGLRLFWTSPDGVEWELTDPSDGVCVLQGGVVGLHFPEVSIFTSESPAVAGQRRRGSRVKARQIEIPLLLWSDGDSVDWVKLDRAFWSAFSFDRPGTLRVEAPDGTVREILAHLDSSGGFAYENNPSSAKWVQYDLVLIADDPYFFGAWMGRAFAPETPASFYGLGGPPFTLSSGSSLGNAQLDNPGDVAAWPVWTVQTGADATTLTISVDDGPLGATVPANSTLVIDTDPRRGTALLNGSDVIGQINPWRPRPIPAGQSVPLSFSASPAPSSITVMIRPRYYRGI